MNLVFTGNGTAGSWKIRGEQIGHALGAAVRPQATTFGDELVVVVKRIPAALALALRGKRWVWDVVDCYPQPEASGWDREQAIDWMRRQLQQYRPTGVIWPNRRMMQDVGFDGPQEVIYHHCRPGMGINPIRKSVRTVGYEGSAPYIDTWLPHLQAECDKRGWRFVVNPGRYTDMDIVIALRGGQWDGYVPQQWKSNVKLANAHGSGTPWIGSSEAGYIETASGAEYWASCLGELRMSLDWLTDHRNREQVQDRFLQKAYPLAKAAEAYKAFLHGL